MASQSIFTFLFLFLFLSCTKTLAQSPAAAPAKTPPIAPAKAPPIAPATAPPAPPVAPVQSPPAPPTLAPAAQVSTSSGPLDIDKIFDKAGHFTIFGRLLKATQTDTELNKQLNNTNNGITIFAPSDSAFGGLKSGTLNAMSDEQKSELVKFHIIPQYIAASQFQTQSNPIRTQAGTGGRVSLNVTTEGSSVNITTGLTNATLVGTVYNDNQLAIYQVDKVLRPLDIFTPKPPPAPAPAPAKAKKATPDAAAPDTESNTTPKDTNVSGGLNLVVDNKAVVVAVGMVAAFLSL